MNILVIGTGYVGLVTATCLAEMGHTVTALDTNTQKIETLKAGKLPFYEPFLLEMIEKNTKAFRLFFASDYTFTDTFDLCFIATGTPPKSSGESDISSIQAAIESVITHCDYPLPIAIKSTVPVGTNAQLTKWVATLTEHAKDYPIISNPEFLKEGAAVEDCMKPSRIILGVNRPREAQIMKRVYTAFTMSSDRVLVMDPPSAELVKYASNAMLATRISFINEMAQVCEKAGGNIHQVRKGMSLDERIGPYFLYAGLGFGGSCFPKDLSALGFLGEQLGLSMPVLKGVMKTNEDSRHHFLDKILTHFNNHPQESAPTLAIWGLSFKPGTDDIRCAPSLFIIEHLLKAGFYLRLYDPAAMEAMKHHFPPSKQVTYCLCEDEAALEADGICLLTEWKQFRSANFPSIIERLKGCVFFDGRNQYIPKEMRTLGFTYYGVGVEKGEPIEKVDHARRETFAIN